MRPHKVRGKKKKKGGKRHPLHPARRKDPYNILTLNRQGEKKKKKKGREKKKWG